MAIHEDTRINSRPSPKNQGHGLFGRLLHRTKSKKEKNEAVDRGASVSPESGDPKPKLHVPVAETLTAPTQHPPLALPPPTSTMGTVSMHGQQPPQVVKRSASIRDRFRAPVKESPSANPEQSQEQRRAAYVPTHAAADFSRLALPRRPSSRQQLRHTYDGPHTLPQQASPEPLDHIAVHSAEDESQTPVDPRHYIPRALETLDENGPVQVTQVGHHEQELDAPQPALFRTSITSSRQQRQGRAAANDLGWSSSHHATSVPAQASESPEEDLIVETRSEEEPPQLSDYELFLARAEERERTHREHLLRTLSQRQYPRPEPEANPYQYRNSASYTADSAVVTDASVPLRKGWDARVSGLDSGIGSKSSSQNGEGSRRHSEEPATRVSNTWERGNRNRSSWTPSFGAGGRDVERTLERGSSAVPELDEGNHPEEAHQNAYITSGNTTASFAERSYAAQQPRTLKRQTSIRQKLGAYIKPIIPPNGFEESESRRGKGKRVTGI